MKRKPSITIRGKERPNGAWKGTVTAHTLRTTGTTPDAKLTDRWLAMEAGFDKHAGK